MTTWKSVPTRLTPEMRSAAATAAREYMQETGRNNIDVMWKAALAAAPETPEKPLCDCPLSYVEALGLETALAPLTRYLGCPGDWGYGTKLGNLTAFLLDLRVEIQQAGKDAVLREARD